MTGCRRFVPVGLALSLLVPTGCAKRVGSRGAGTHDVTIREFAYRPDKLEITLGDTVRWLNADGFTHTATADAMSFNTGDIEGEGHSSFAPRIKGTFAYHCTRHPQMRGKIVVQ